MDGKDYAAALREIADWYEQHPEVPFSRFITVGGVEKTREQAAEIARTLGACRKEHLDTTFHLTRTFSGVDLCFVFWRATVCDRVVVGVEEIPEKVEPAHTREKIEWRCAPIFQEES